MNECPVEVRHWINAYTALCDIRPETTVEIGDEFEIPTREVPTDTWRQRLRIWVNKQLTPPNEYHNIHLEKDVVTTEVTAAAETECVLEIVYARKHHGRKSIHDHVTDLYL